MIIYAIYVLLEILEAAGLKSFQIQSDADDLVKSLHLCLSGLPQNKDNGLPPAPFPVACSRCSDASTSILSCCHSKRAVVENIPDLK